MVFNQIVLNVDISLELPWVVASDVARLLQYWAEVNSIIEKMIRPRLYIIQLS